LILSRYYACILLLSCIPELPPAAARKLALASTRRLNSCLSPTRKQPGISSGLSIKSAT
jgi:hypothetical protein